MARIGEDQQPPGWYPDPSGQPAARWWWDVVAVLDTGGGSLPASLDRVSPRTTCRLGSPARRGRPAAAGTVGNTCPHVAWLGGRAGSRQPPPQPGSGRLFDRLDPPGGGDLDGILAGAFVLGLLFLSGLLQALSLAIFPGSSAAETLLGEIGLWAGFAGTCVLASRRFGTSGSLVRDFGWRVRPIDVGYGVLGALACLFTAGVIEGAFHGTVFAGSNTDIITSQQGNTVGVAIVTVVAAVGAPVFEELFFRGFLRQSFASRFGVGAVWIQAMFFGLAHYQFGLGLGNVSVCVATAGIGVVLGYTAYLTGRLGSDTVAHGLFNLFVTLSIIGVIR